MGARYGAGSTRGRKVTGSDEPLYEPIDKGLTYTPPTNAQLDRQRLYIAAAYHRKKKDEQQQAQSVGKGLVSMAALKTGAKTADAALSTGIKAAKPKLLQGAKAATSTPARAALTAGGAGIAAGSLIATGGAKAAQPPMAPLPYSYPFNKADRRRAFDPEGQRQRRVGMAESALLLGGGYAGQRGFRGIQRDTRELRSQRIQDAVTKPMTTVGSKVGRKAIAVSRRNGALLAGGAAAIAASGGVRHWGNTTQGRTYR